MPFELGLLGEKPVIPSKKPTTTENDDGLVLQKVGATGFEPGVALYLLRYPASV